MKTYSTPIRPIVYAASLLLMCGSIASAETTPNSSATAVDSTMNAHPQLARGDRRFVEKIAKISAEDVALSRLAADRASREEVREFARQLIADHEKANSDLSLLASNKGVVLPVADRTKLDRWANKKGKDFDEDYLEKMIDGHKDAVDAMESSAKKAEDTDVAAYARDHLAAMQEHLRKAKDLKKLVD